MTSAIPLNDKFSSVKLPDICAPRHAVVNLFHKAAEKRIVYVSAPAGYGKTVSTQLWLKNSSRVPLWIGLDEYDNTPSIFYKLFCNGILSLQPDNRAMSKTLGSPTFGSSPVEHTIRLLSEFVPDNRQYAVVFDDMHLISNKEIRKSGLLVQKRLPASFVLLVLTRNEVAEEYLSLTGKEKCAVITAKDLAFKTDEIQKYFNAHGRFITSEEAFTAHAVTNGWAIGVNALAMSGQVELGQSAGQVLGDFIRTQIWDKWDESMQAFLLKTSVLDEMTPEFAQALTGEPDSKKILENLCVNNMFVGKTYDEHYRYHHLFLDFLRDILNSQSAIDANTLYVKAARHYYNSGIYYKAAEYFIRCGSHDGISKALDKVTEFASGLSVEEEYNYIKLLINNVGDKASGEFLSSDMYLVQMLSWYYFLCGEAQRFEHYVDILYANLTLIGKRYPKLLETVGFIGALDFREDLYVFSQKLAQQLSGVLENTEEKRPQSSSLTQNLPFAHRSMRDYSEFAIDTATRLAHLESAFMPLIGNGYYVIEDCVLAGLYYERNVLSRAMEYAASACEKCQTDYGVELRFCSQMISMAVSQAMSKHKVRCKDIDEMLESENAVYLRNNLLAYESKIKLWGGDKRAARAWLENYFVAGTEQLEFYRLFQHFTTARAYIVLSQTDKAINYIIKLKKLATDYRRPLDIAEANVLQAALEWAMGNKEEALGTLETTLTALQKFGFMRVVSDEGAAVLPILKKLTLNLKKESSQSALDARFLNEVTIAAYGQSKRYKGIAMNICASNPVKLSKQQKHIIMLMAKGYKNAEIVNLTGLTIHTVKSHQAAAYAKLGVNSAMDAVVKARELGLTE